MHITELLTPAYEVAWLPWAVQYFFLVGIATGAALLAAWCGWGPEGSRRRRLLPAVLFTLAVTALAAPFSLLADLHQPARFWHFYAHFTPWSWMSLGSLLMPAFVGLSLATCASWWLGRLNWARWLAPLLVLSALGVVVYSGGEMMVVRARPLWNTVWVPVNLTLTGWLAAVGAIFILERFLPAALRPGADALQALRLAGLGLAAALVAAALSWAAVGLTAGSASFSQAVHLFSSFPTWRSTMIGSAIGGVAVVAALLAGRRLMQHRGYTLALGLGLAAAAWIFRWALFMGVQSVPKYGAGLYVYSMPLGGDGLMGMLGIAGLCIALVAMLGWGLELYPPHTGVAPDRSAAAPATSSHGLQEPSHG